MSYGILRFHSRSVKVIDPFANPIVDVDPFAMVDVVRAAGDLVEEFEVLADQRGDVLDRGNQSWTRHQAASSWMIDVARDQFQGSRFGILANTSASQACGSISFIFFCRNDQRIHEGGTLAAALGAGE